jgi:Ca-activated chloride channel family protein
MRLFGLDYAHPWFLLAALAAVPALWWSLRSSGRVVFSSLAALPARATTWRTALAWLPDGMIATAVIALAFALAGPRKGDDTQRIRSEGIAIVMAIDISSSMRALDLATAERPDDTRLDAVKRLFQQFVLGGGDLRGRPDDAIGLVSFAGHADTRSPLTLDHGNLATAAGQLAIVTDRREDGTAIGDGLALAVERLRKHAARSKVVVLLTDGVSNAGKLTTRAATELAVEHGIKVYTIGAGTNGFAPMKVKGQGIVQVPVEIDETTLKAIAARTGGVYFPATDFTALAAVYAAIDKLERTSLEEQRFYRFHEYYPWFLATALGLIVVALVLRGTALRRIP